LYAKPLESADSALLTRAPSALHIVAKRQGSKLENRQLIARAAMAAALWHFAPEPKPRISYVASDVHGPDRTPDAELVRSLLTDRFHVPASSLLLRTRANCTFLEVRRVRALSRAAGLEHILALTHAYHARRVQRYFNEVMDGVTVLPVDFEGIDGVLRASVQPVLFHEVRKLVERARPDPLDLARESVVEWLLSGFHSLDPRGRLERRLADLLRTESRRG
jgi:uncharacterized SAM-binding protein YcdF (DUF218 family)